MGNYFKDALHFENFIRKVLREDGQDVDPEQLLPIGVYVDSAFNGSLADEFGKALRHLPTLLHENKFWNWLRINKLNGYVIERAIEHIVTAEFQEAMPSLKNRPGVYSFWNESDVPLYVGVSIDLASRITSSFKERFRHYSDVVYLKYAVTKTASDAAVWEAITIARLHPALNTTGKYNDELTIGVPDLTLSERIPVNVPGEKFTGPNGDVILQEDRYKGFGQ